MQAHLDEGTDPWGVKVERVEMWIFRINYFSFFLFIIWIIYLVKMYDCLLICNVAWLRKLKVRIDFVFCCLIRFASFLTAAREARAKIIAAEGEQKASRSLKVKIILF
jgi:hypothetical protein